MTHAHLRRIEALERMRGRAAPPGRIQILEEGVARDEARASATQQTVIHIGAEGVALYRSYEFEVDHDGPYAGAADRLTAKVADLCRGMRGSAKPDREKSSQMERLAWALVHKPWCGVEVLQ